MYCSDLQLKHSFGKLHAQSNGQRNEPRNVANGMNRHRTFGIEVPYSFSVVSLQSVKQNPVSTWKHNARIEIQSQRKPLLT